jgi:hypothetical protein
MGSSELGYPIRRWDDLSIMRQYSAYEGLLCTREPRFRRAFDDLEREWEDENDGPTQSIIYLSQALALTAKHAGVTLFHMCSPKSKCKPRDGEYTGNSKRAFGMA